MNETTTATNKPTANEANEANEIQDALNQFTGSEQLHKFSILSNLRITDGVKYIAETTGSFWILDIIASFQRKCQRDPMLKDFQIWTLKVKPSNTKYMAKVVCERDTDDIAFTKHIPYTDFPLAEIKLYCENGVICLPQER